VSGGVSFALIARPFTTRRRHLVGDEAGYGVRRPIGLLAGHEPQIGSIRRPLKAGRVDGVLLDNGQAIKARHVIVATPAHVSGPMLTEEFEPARAFLSSFPHLDMPLVFFFLDRPLNHDVVRFYGHPYREAAFNMGMNHAHKTSHLSPSGKAIISAWPTFPSTVELMAKSDEELIAHALADMELFVPGMRGWIEHAAIVRHSPAVARYSVGSVKKILDFKAYAQTLEGVSFAGAETITRRRRHVDAHKQ